MTGPSRRAVLAAGAGGSLALLAGAGGAQARLSKLDLWDNSRGTQLRGAVISQRRVYRDIDGPEFLGPGPAGSPVSDQALRLLARSGANLLVLSHPGICRVAAPYQVDAAMEAHLDDLVERAGRAGLFVVIGFRSGPGRSDFTFHRDSAGSWFPASMIDEHVWQSEAAQDGWETMWRRVARRYRGHAHVAGYLLMVEPNANQVARGPDGGDLEEWDPQRLAERVADTPADWPRLARRLARAVREEDGETPLLVSPDGYASQRFAGLLDLQAVPGQVLALHDYAPRDYTHQDPDGHIGFAPWQAAYVPPAHTPWMMGEFGVSRWAPRAADYLSQRISSLEAAGAGWAVFRWDTGWRVYEDSENRFNPLYGDQPGADAPDAYSPLLAALRVAWRANRHVPPGRLRR
ncbi:glycoside hydrolase family 5 protein [Maricaulis sp. CAU 1757]